MNTNAIFFNEYEKNRIKNDRIFFFEFSRKSSAGKCRIYDAILDFPI